MCYGGYDDEIPLDRIHGRRVEKLRRWLVVDSDGGKHVVEGHFAFNNGDEGLVFRRRRPNSDYTSVVASWGQGFWRFFKEIEDGEK